MAHLCCLVLLLVLMYAGGASCGHGSQVVAVVSQQHGSDEEGCGPSHRPCRTVSFALSSSSSSYSSFGMRILLLDSVHEECNVTVPSGTTVDGSGGGGVVVWRPPPGCAEGAMQADGCIGIRSIRFDSFSRLCHNSSDGNGVNSGMVCGGGAVAVYACNGEVSIEHVSFVNCSVSTSTAAFLPAFGGGLYFNGTGALELANTTFVGCSVTGRASAGGGLYTAAVNVTIVNALFDGNEAIAPGRAAGGGLALDLLSSARSCAILHDVLVIRNTLHGTFAAAGGGIAVRSKSNDSTVVLRRVQVLENAFALRSYVGLVQGGGGMALEAQHVHLESVLVQGNSFKLISSSIRAPCNGGGALLRSIHLVLRNCTFRSNILYIINLLSTDFVATGAAFDVTQPIHAPRTFNSSLEIFDCIVEGNGCVPQANGVVAGAHLVGGVISIGVYHVIKIERSIIRNNTAEASSTITDDAGTAVGGIMFIEAAESAVTLRDIQFDDNTVVAGNSSSQSGGFVIGGVVYIRATEFIHSGVQIYNTSFHNNTVTTGGSQRGFSGQVQGGIFCVLNVHDLLLLQCSFVNNTISVGASDTAARWALGGALALLSLTSSAPSRAALVECHFEGIVLTGGKGGLSMVGGHAVGAALYVEAIEHVVLHDCIVAGCVARGGDAGRGGGGAYGIAAFLSVSSVSMTECRFFDNTLLAGQGSSYGDVFGVITLTASHDASLELSSVEIVGTSLQAGNSLITGGAIAVSSLRLNDPLLPQKVHAVLHNITISHMLLQGVPRGGAVCLRSCNATLQQVQVVGAHTHLNEPDEVKGGAVVVEDSQLWWTNGIVHSFTFSGCSGGAGAGLHALNSSLSLHNVSFYKNGFNNSRKQVSLGWTANSRIDSDRNPFSHGGALYTDTATSMVLRNCDFSRNYAASGGAIAIVGNSESTNLSVSGCVFGNNHALYYGGALSFHCANTVDHDSIDPYYISVDDSYFFENKAERGGCISGTMPQSSCHLSHCRMENNSALFGGVLWSSASDFTFSNSTSCTANCAEEGGGVFASASGGLRLAHVCAEANSCFLSGNTASYGAEEGGLPDALVVTCPSSLTIDGGHVFSVEIALRDEYGNAVQGPLLATNKVLMAPVSNPSSCNVTLSPTNAVVNIDGVVQYSGQLLPEMRNGTICQMNYYASAAADIENAGFLAFGHCSILLAGCPSGFHVASGTNGDFCVVDCGVECYVLWVTVAFLLLASVVAAAICGFCVYRFVQRRRRVRMANLVTTPNLTVNEIVNDPDITLLDGNLLERLEIVASGAQGVVWRSRHKRTGEIVAIKTLHVVEQPSPEDLRQFLTEVKITSALRHPNICPLKGIVLLSGAEPIGMVSEFCMHGSLQRRLHNHANWSLEERLSLLIGVATGLAYLHDNNVVHRDIKPANILLGDDGRPMLIDFGCSAVGSLEKRLHTMIGTPAYMAPELLQHSDSNFKLDIYAMGILINEVISLSRPYEELGDQARWIASEVTEHYLRPFLPRFYPPSLHILVQECWHRDPEVRPTAAEIQSRLRRFKKTLSKPAEKEEREGDVEMEEGPNGLTCGQRLERCVRGEMISEETPNKVFSINS